MSLRANSWAVLEEEAMTPETNRKDEVRKMMVSVLAFVLLAGVGYMVITMYMR